MCPQPLGSLDRRLGGMGPCRVRCGFFATAAGRTGIDASCWLLPLLGVHATVTVAGLVAAPPVLSGITSTVRPPTLKVIVPLLAATAGAAVPAAASFSPPEAGMATG